MNTYSEPIQKLHSPEMNDKSWRAFVESELRGISFDALTTRTVEGIEIQPLYTPAGDTEFFRGKKRDYIDCVLRDELLRRRYPSGSRMCQEILWTTPDRVSIERQEAAGAAPAEISITWSSPDPPSVKELDVACGAASRALVPINWKVKNDALSFGQSLTKYFGNTSGTSAALTGGVIVDPLANLILSGVCEDLEANLDNLAEWTGWAQVNAGQLSTIGISARHWHEGGANLTEELCNSVAAGVEYIRELTRRGVEPPAIVPRMRFEFAIGSDLFGEIAKLRAFRILWANVQQAYGLSGQQARPTVHAATSHKNISQLDAQVNLLRTTTEALAAVIGGVDTLHIGAFDEFGGGATELGRRLAHNIHIILAEEFHINTPMDPVGGSWYADRLTYEIAEQSWRQFQEIEKQGGYIHAVKSGFIQRRVSASSKVAHDRIYSRRDRMIGVNCYPNAEDKIDNKRGADEAPGLHTAAANDVNGNHHSLHTIQPLFPSRLSEPFEKLRTIANRFERQTGERPTVLLANIGAREQFEPRHAFAKEYFSVLGFDTQTRVFTEAPVEAATIAAQFGDKVIVLCSADSCYPNFAPEFAQRVRAINPRTMLIIAGKPGAFVDLYATCGIAEFIFTGSDLLAGARKVWTHLLENYESHVSS